MQHQHGSCPLQNLLLACSGFTHSASSPPSTCLQETLQGFKPGVTLKVLRAIASTDFSFPRAALVPSVPGRDRGYHRGEQGVALWNWLACFMSCLLRRRMLGQCLFSRRLSGQAAQVTATIPVACFRQGDGEVGADQAAAHPAEPWTATVPWQRAVRVR